MLERLKVPSEDQVHVTHQSLYKTVTALFEAMGESSEDAATATDVLVYADLRGIDSHGVSNMMPRYLGYYEEGRVKADHNWRIVRESPGMATIDADRGLALILGPMAMQMAIDKAREVGIGVVTLFNAGHSGAIGYHALIAAEQDMIGMCMTAGGQVVVPTFAAKPMLGTSPIALAAPSRTEAPFVFDAASSSVAQNKIWIANRLGVKIPSGWIADDDGTPIMEEVIPPDGATAPLLPLGSTREQGSHKGYGLVMIPEILATLLSGSVPHMLSGVKKSDHHFAAYNIAAFTDIEEFKDNMDRTLNMLKNTKPAPGHDRVVYAGLLEHEEEQIRRVEGIPLHKDVIQWFDDITAELSVPTLETV